MTSDYTTMPNSRKHTKKSNIIREHDFIIKSIWSYCIQKIHWRWYSCSKYRCTHSDGQKSKHLFIVIQIFASVQSVHTNDARNAISSVCVNKCRNSEDFVLIKVIYRNILIWNYCFEKSFPQGEICHTWLGKILMFLKSTPNKLRVNH